LKICYSIQALALITSYFSCYAHESELSKPFEKIHAHQLFEAHVHTGWQSRYFSEGRDALNGKSLGTGALEFGYDHFSGGVWYGRSSNHQYDEWQYNLALTQEIDGFEIYAGYTHLVFAKDRESDDEWSLGMSYEGFLFDLTTSLEACHSMDAKGTFYEWSNIREFHPKDDLDISLSGTFGWNEGYVTDGHNGLNFFSLGSGITKILTESISLTGHGIGSWAIDQNSNLEGDQSLKDFFHFGLSVEFDF
tara:strand:+ start:107 stop:853 length:747 start_codon:yes stop_codon:yes gene_type:complete